MPRPGHKLPDGSWCAAPATETVPVCDSMECASGPSTPALTYREGVENPGWARYVGVLCGGCARVARVRLGEMAATRRKIEAQAEVPVDWEKASARRW